MDKSRVVNFDPDICLGKHPDVSGPCPKLAKIDEDTGRPIVDTLRRIEARVVNGLQDGACGMCGCPLKNLAVLSRAPNECPRFHLHNR